MNSHEPQNYRCPFCLLTSGGQDAHSDQQDIIHKDDFVVAFIAPKWWPNNPANVLVVPVKHYENVYGVPDDVLEKAYGVAKRVAIAMRASYDGCEGTSMRQHNEPAGGQDVWHFHIQVFARRMGDRLYQDYDDAKFVEAKLRRPYAEKLRSALSKAAIMRP